MKFEAKKSLDLILLSVLCYSLKAVGWLILDSYITITETVYQKYKFPCKYLAMNFKKCTFCRTNKYFYTFIHMSDRAI